MATDIPKTRARYALFRNGNQISKTHSTMEAVWIEGFELGAMVTYGPIQSELATGYEIKEVPPPT